MVNYRIIYTQDFADDVSAAMVYVSSYSNEYHSNKLRLQIDKVIEVIEQFPASGRKYYARDDVIVRRLAVPGSKFSIFYSIIGRDIYLLGLTHGSVLIK